MIGFGQVLSDEDIWALIQYERTFAGRHGRGMKGHRKGRGPMMGPRGRMGGMERRELREEMGGCQREGCDE